MNLLLYFIIYAVAGYLLETVYGYLLYRKYTVRRTMLTLPMCPVYGLGGVMMALLVAPLRISPVSVFCGGFLVCSGVEYLYAAVSERRFGVMWWDYSAARWNVKGRICAAYSLMWGGLAFVFVYWIHPYVVWVVAPMSPYYKLILCAVLYSMFAKDLKDTASELKKFSKGEENSVEGVLPLKRCENRAV